VLLTSR